MGISKLRKPINKKLEDFKEKHTTGFWDNRKIMASIIFGSIIGIICGIFGADGGIMILLILTLVPGYDIKVAIGTSVLIMTFAALSGTAGYFISEGVFSWQKILIAGFGAIIGAKQLQFLQIWHPKKSFQG